MHTPTFFTAPILAMTEAFGKMAQSHLRFHGAALEATLDVSKALLNADPAKMAPVAQAAVVDLWSRQRDNLATLAKEQGAIMAEQMKAAQA